MLSLVCIGEKLFLGAQKLLLRCKIVLVFNSNIRFEPQIINWSMDNWECVVHDKHQVQFMNRRISGFNFRTPTRNQIIETPQTEILSVLRVQEYVSQPVSEMGTTTIIQQKT